MSSIEKLNLLYIEDEPNILSEVVFILSEYVNKVYTAYDGKSGLDKFQELKDNNINIDIVITDVSMPQINGIDMLKKIAQEDNNINFIILTAKSSNYIYSKLGDLEVKDILYKPFDATSLIKSIKNICESI
jgi:YesN/AraC family two-component response regulator